MDYAAIIEASAESAGFDTDDADSVYADDSPSDDAPETSSSDPDPSDDSTATVDDPPPAEATTEEKPEATPPPADDEEELAAIAKELTEKNPALNKGKLPVSRHQAILERARRKHDADIKALNEKYAKYEDAEFQAKMSVTELAATDPDGYLARLYQLPQYRERIDRIIASRTAQPAAEPPAPAAQPKDDPEPQPDYMFPDGSLGFSAAAQKQWQEWSQRKIAADYEKKLNERLGPVEARVKAEAERERQQQETAQNYATADDALSAAKTWPGFEEYAEDIRQETLKPKYDGMTAYKALSMAYGAVVPSKLRLKEEQLKAQVKAETLKELNEKSRAKRQAQPGTAPSVVTGERSVLDIVREAAQALGDDE